MEKPERPIKLNIVIEPNEYLIMRAIKEVTGATLGWQLEKAKQKYIKAAQDELINNHGYILTAEGEIKKPAKANQ